MCEIMEKLIAEREKEQEKELTTKIALKLLADGKYNYEGIAQVTGLSLAEVMALAGEKTA